MNDTKAFRLITSTAISAAITALFIVGITIGAEIIPSLKSWIATTFYHHWVGKGILSVILFVVVAVITFVFSNATDDRSAHRALMALFWAVLFGMIVLGAFFFYESFAH